MIYTSSFIRAIVLYKRLKVKLRDGMKKLTIGITTYNNVPFIYNLLYEIDSQVKLNKSILDNIDFIIYDDYSSKQEFLNYIPSYFKVIIAEENSGSPANGRNTIIKNANSEYLFFIDGDDLLVSSLTKIIDELNTKDADIIFSEVVKLGVDGQYIKSPFIYTYSLMDPLTPKDVLEKICVHQTGIWSIYKVEFLQTNNISYTTSIRYEDNLFLYTILMNNPEIDVLRTPYYGWRVNVKSFSHSSESIRQRKLVYRKTMELLTTDLDNKFAPYILFSIWNQTYTNIIRNYPNLNTRQAKHFYKKLALVSHDYKKEIKYLKNKVDFNYVDKYFRYSNLPLCKGFDKLFILKNFNRLKRSKSKIKKEISKAFTFLPQNQNKVFMMSQYGQFTSNPKYHYYQIKDAPNKKIVYFVKDKDLIDNVHFYDYNNKLQFYYHFYTSKVVYFDSWLDPELVKRKGQSWIQMWHGYPYKKMFTDIEIYGKVNPNTKHQKKMNNIMKWDMIYSLDANNTKIFEHLFPTVEVIEAEYPRITWLKENQNNLELKQKIRTKYNLEPGKKYALFAPTYRPYKVYFNSEEIAQLVKPDHELLYHPHPMLNSNFRFSGRELMDIEIQEILLVIDQVITDYSSIKYDFMKINSPENVTNYMPDKELYDMLHGTYQY